MMAAHQPLSGIKKKALIFMLSVERQSPGLFPARYIKQAIKKCCVDETCYSLESAGLIRTVKTPGHQVLTGLTGAGRRMALSLMLAEYGSWQAAGYPALPSRRPTGVWRDREVDVRGRTYSVGRAVYVIRPDGSVSLALFSENSGQVWLSGDARQVAGWYLACYDAGLPVQVQVEADPGLPSAYEKKPRKFNAGLA